MSDGSPAPRVRLWDGTFNLLHDTDTDGPVPFTCNAAVDSGFDIGEFAAYYAEAFRTMGGWPA